MLRGWTPPWVLKTSRSHARHSKRSFVPRRRDTRAWHNHRLNYAFKPSVFFFTLYLPSLYLSSDFLEHTHLRTLRFRTRNIWNNISDRDVVCPHSRGEKKRPAFDYFVPQVISNAGGKICTSLYRLQSVSLPFRWGFTIDGLSNTWTDRTVFTLYFDVSQVPRPLRRVVYIYIYIGWIMFVSR